MGKIGLGGYLFRFEKVVPLKPARRSTRKPSGSSFSALKKSDPIEAHIAPPEFSGVTLFSALKKAAPIEAVNPAFPVLQKMRFFRFKKRPH
ncbi:MAG: hypothetical protein RML57_13825 [Acidobacteriota bacterium]|nr:hypothetical protein [Acidobacteriota bacterium]